jgi:hypothetical protein
VEPSATFEAAATLKQVAVKIFPVETEDMKRNFKLLWMIALAVFLGGGMAHADVGLILNSSMDTGSSWLTSAGHSAIYLSNVCPDGSPVKLRLCAPGEEGSVLSNYADFEENRKYEWNIVPVSVFLYGVKNPADRPLYASLELRKMLQDEYRLASMRGVCESTECATDPDANWRDLVAATFVRTVYIFEVKTTEEQDRKFIEHFNATPNVSRYSGFHYNCADFAKDVVNFYFPHAVHSNRVNDLGLTGPKAICRSLTHYASHRPAMELRVTRFSQLPSDLRRSDNAREATETIFRTKKCLFPMMLRPEYLGFFTASYWISGRFNVEKTFRQFGPDEALASVELAGEAKPELARTAAAEAEAWQGYKTSLAGEVKQAEALGVIQSEGELKDVFRELETRGAPHYDKQGRLWMRWTPAGQAGEDGQVKEFGITPATLVSAKSDSPMAYKMQLARVSFFLHSTGKEREPLPEFQQDWQLMEKARNVVVGERSEARMREEAGHGTTGQ